MEEAETFEVDDLVELDPKHFSKLALGMAGWKDQVLTVAVTREGSRTVVRVKRSGGDTQLFYTWRLRYVSGVQVFNRWVKEENGRS